MVRSVNVTVEPLRNVSLFDLVDSKAAADSEYFMVETHKQNLSKIIYGEI